MQIRALIYFDELVRTNSMRQAAENLNVAPTAISRQIENLEGRRINGATVIAERVEGLDAKQLRTVADTLRNKWGSAVIVIASVNDSNVSIISAVSKDLTAKVQAGKLVGEVAKAVGGKGGGRPDMAEGAGKNPAALSSALASVYQQVGALL